MCRGLGSIPIQTKSTATSRHLVQSAICWCTFVQNVLFLSCRNRGVVQVVEPGTGESPCVSSVRADSKRIQWEFVGAGRQERQDKWKGERGAHQATGQATVQWCPGGDQPRHLYQWREISERETAACTDCSRVQSTGRIGALWRQRADATPRIPPGRVESQAVWSKTDRTTSRRIAWSHFEVPKASCGSGNCQSGSRSHYHQRDRGHRELPGSTCGTRATLCFICGVSQGRWTGQWDARVACKHSIINRQTRAGDQQYRQRRSCTIHSRSAGPSTSANPTRCAAEWNTGQYYPHVRCVESREQARGQCRLATEHEQSAAHNEDDDGRDAATRGHQGSTAGNVVRLMIATINVKSATSGGGATKAHVPDTGGLNITGRMAELDNLFSEADIDTIGVQESRLPQTQILQTRDCTVFNSGASPGKHHYGVQLWIRKRPAKAVKSTEAVNPRLLVAKIAMRASSHDRVAWILHVFVLHPPCEVAAPHASAQAHEHHSAWSVVSAAW